MDLSNRRKQAEENLQQYATEESNLQAQLEQIKQLKHQAIGEVKLLMQLEEENSNNGAVPAEMAEEVIAEAE